MGPENRNEAARFVTLIDALYENKVKLIAAADAPPGGPDAGAAEAREGREHRLAVGQADDSGDADHGDTLNKGN